MTLEQSFENLIEAVKKVGSILEQLPELNIEDRQTLTAEAVIMNALNN